MSVTSTVIVLHALTAFAFIGGLVGRDVVLWQAARTSDIRQVCPLAAAAKLFDRFMVIPGSFAVLGFGLLALWLRGLSPLGFLQGAHTNWLLISLLLYLSQAALVPTVFLPRRAVFEKALDVAQAQQRMTPELRAAFGDHVVTYARRYEFVTTAMIIALMIARPF
jgi:uncharacterized membrane protein